MSRTRRALIIPAAGITAALLTAAPAFATSTDSGSAQADLTPVPVNDAPGSGSAMIEVDGTTISFDLAYEGLLADSPHAAHIHFGADARHECPTAADDTAGDGFLDTTDGAPAYGPIVTSLTTEGDTSPESGLAIDRFGVGDDVDYSRDDVEVSAEVSAAILAGQGVVVVHGVDHNGNGEYDAGDRGMSDLDPSLPGEATDHALCGVAQASQMTDMPAGGVQTGEASVGGADLGLAIAGGAVALAGGALLVARRRSATDNS